MTQARIHVQLSEGTWKGDVSRDHSGLSVQLLSTVRRGDCTTEAVAFSGHASDACLSDLESHPDVDSFDIIERGRNGVTVRLETLDQPVLSSVARAGTPPLYPVEISCGELIATVVGTHASISTLGGELRTLDSDFELGSIRSDHDVSEVLTERQKEVFFTAVEHGYYRNPRQCTLTEVADILGIAKSTCSGMLQRAEANIVEYFCLHQQLPGQDLARSQRTPVSDPPGG